MKNESNILIIEAPCSGTIDSIKFQQKDLIAKGNYLLTIESMKMQYPIKCSQEGSIKQLFVKEGETVEQGQLLASIQLGENAINNERDQANENIEGIRLELEEVIQRHQLTLDEARPCAVEKRHAKGMRTARENVCDLLDENSFHEYGAMLLAGQRGRLTQDELIDQTPADGLIAGTGSINNQLFDDDSSRCMVLAYDYSVFAGTQGIMNHKKMDRMLDLAKQWKIPVVLFAEGGGGRPSDSDYNGVSGLDCHTFVALAALSGLVPTIGIVAGRCFAGNAALLGVCNVIIATQNSTIGMAGPSMIEGGGLGKFKPEEVGPVSIQVPNGVIDILVKDEAEAVAVSKKYLSYFQGDLADWNAIDQELLRDVIPKNRKQVYDMRVVIKHLADSDSYLELREQYSPGMITAFIRIAGKAFGLMANNPAHLGGAIESSAGDKAARFMQLCDGFDIPIISLCDTPGFMVGPAAEQQGTVRHISRIFVTAASLTVPFFTLVLRKGYGLGAQAMSAGSFHASFFTAAWPTGEFGAMGIEGSIKLAYAKQLRSIADERKRKELFDELVAKAYEKGKALNVASFHEIDAVIDPAKSREWILAGLKSTPKVEKRTEKKRPCIDTW